MLKLLYVLMMEEIRRPERHPKGWGYEDWIVNNSNYCSKILHFENGKKLSWHYHKVKVETFFVLSGKLILRIGESDDIGHSEEIELNEGDTYTIDREIRHQLIALKDSQVLETSTQHFEEDSYRIIRGD
jgi:Uncharacterized conserved protein, contains double-stranded beta-helix domain